MSDQISWLCSLWRLPADGLAALLTLAALAALLLPLRLARLDPARDPSADAAVASA